MDTKGEGEKTIGNYFQRKKKKKDPIRPAKTWLTRGKKTGDTVQNRTGGQSIGGGARNKLKKKKMVLKKGPAALQKKGKKKLGGRLEPKKKGNQCT